MHWLASSEGTLHDKIVLEPRPLGLKLNAPLISAIMISQYNLVICDIIWTQCRFDWSEMGLCRNGMA